MRVFAHAKINWSLSVLGRRADGYHILDMLVHSVDLADTIEMSAADALTLTLQGNRRLPSDGHNLVLKAAEALQSAYDVRKGADISLRKRIPIGAGLGGGSADAAAALVGLNRLWDLRLSAENLAEIGLRIGADVPFCLTGGLARVGGIGEEIAPLRCGAQMHLLIAQPCAGLSTPLVFKAYDALGEKPSNPSVDAAATALEAGEARALAATMGNALTAAAVPLRPEIAVCCQAMEHYGALCAQMTGSGSAVIGLFDDEAVMTRAYRACSRIWPKCFATHTISHGVSVMTALPT